MKNTYGKKFPAILRRVMQLKSLPVEDTNPFIPLIQYHGCVWQCRKTRENISVPTADKSCTDPYAFRRFLQAI